MVHRNPIVGLLKRQKIYPSIVSLESRPNNDGTSTRPLEGRAPQNRGKPDLPLLLGAGRRDFLGTPSRESSS